MATSGVVIICQENAGVALNRLPVATHQLASVPSVHPLACFSSLDEVVSDLYARPINAPSIHRVWPPHLDNDYPECTSLSEESLYPSHPTTRILTADHLVNIVLVLLRLVVGSRPH